MKALTITQPWAGLVASGIKLVENRTWKPSPKLIGQRFAIHASRKIDEDVYQRIGEIDPDLQLTKPQRDSSWYHLSRVTGSIIAVATLTAVVTDVLELDAHYLARGIVDRHQIPWFFGPVGFVLSDVRVITPIECKGALSFWQVPDDVAEQVEAQLR